MANKWRPATPFAAWFRKHRERIGCSQEEIAKRIGISKGAVGGWEHRGTHPSEPETVSSIAQVFQVKEGDVRRAIEEKGHALDGEVASPVIKGSSLGCSSCKRKQECKQMVKDGFPILCESITEDDVLATALRGLEPNSLMEGRR